MSLSRKNFRVQSRREMEVPRPPDRRDAARADRDGKGQEGRALATVTLLRSKARKPGGSLRSMDPEAGLATAEYAIATLAAVGFAALLVAVLSSGEVRGLLMSLITSALSFG